jgi:hypothetical protein
MKDKLPIWWAVFLRCLFLCFYYFMTQWLAQALGMWLGLNSVGEKRLHSLILGGDWIFYAINRLFP